MPIATLFLVLAMQAAPAAPPARVGTHWRSAPSGRSRPVLPPHASLDRLYASQLREEPPLVAPPKAFEAMDANALDAERFLKALAGTPQGDELRPGEAVFVKDHRVIRVPVQVRVHRCRGPICGECGVFIVGRAI